MIPMSEGGGSQTKLPWEAVLVVVLAGWGVLTSAPRLASLRPEGGDVPALLECGDGKAPARLWQDPLEAVRRHARRSKEGNPTVSNASKTQEQATRTDKNTPGDSAQRQSRQQALTSDGVIPQAQWPDSTVNTASKDPEQPPRPDGNRSGDVAQRQPQRDDLIKDCQSIDTVCGSPGKGEKVLLLPVILRGGPYSEDREFRLRTRYAVVSALGVAGYQPKDTD